MNYLIVDLETYGFKTYKRFCNPLDPNHYVVANCYKMRGQEATVEYSVTGLDIQTFFDNIDLESVDLLVGQNFKFDMLWFWGCERFQTWLKNGGRIWDTLQAEYLLRGQQGQVHGGRGKDSLSLDALSIKYGGTLKDEEVKADFKNGKTVLDIPKDKLIEYGKYDVINTEIVFLGQVKAAKKLNMVPIISVYNEHLLAVTEMEYNGMYVNQERAERLEAELALKLEQIEDELNENLREYKLWPVNDLPFNVASPKQMATLFYGDLATVTRTENMIAEDGTVLRFKSGLKKGEIKTRKVKHDIFIEGFKIPFDESWRTDTGGRGTGADILKELCDLCPREDLKEIVNIILEFKKYHKLLGTYLRGTVSLAHPDGCVHSEYQTCHTETGRLSSRVPNLQNQPPAVIELFESRYGKAGRIIEADFSQLEVVVQAYITQCTKMIEDIESGLDFHCMRLAYAVGKEYDEVVKLCDTEKEWKTKRSKVAKPISFQKAYGAMPPKIAATAGISEELVQKVFDKEDERYPEINAFYEGMVSTIDRNSIVSDIPLQVRVNGIYKQSKKHFTTLGKWQNINGKIYTFAKKAVLGKKGIFEYWSMPNVMNYPIQGTAADIVAMQTAKVFRYMIHHRDKGLMVNEIHDSNILDVREEYVDEIQENVVRILSDVKTSFKERFDLDFNAPISVDANNGLTWKEAK